MTDDLFRLLAIDPSVTCTGYAWFTHNNSLRSCGVKQADNVADATRRAWRFRTLSIVAIEFPRIYPVSKQKGDPNDILAVAAIAGAYAAQGERVLFYNPHEWKGQLPKKVCEERIRAKLDAAELAVLECTLNTIPKRLQNNAIDAVGIGLHALGRGIR